MASPAVRHQPVRVSLPAAGVAVFESVHADDFTAPVMNHAFHKMLLPIRGEGVVTVEARQLPLTPAAVVLVPRRKPHTLADTPGRPLTLLAVCFAPWALDRLTPPLETPMRAADESLVGSSLRAVMRRMLYEQTRQPGGYELMLRGLLQQAVATLLRNADTPPRPEAGSAADAVDRFVRRLERDFIHAGDLDTAARQAGVSRRRFTELFRRETGETYRRHLERLRIDHARRLLLDSDRTVAAIAFECGFDDLSSFYRAFRRVEGRPPLAVRGEPTAGAS